jgi:hypothetical protein
VLKSFGEASRFVGLKEKLLLFILQLNMQGMSLAFNCDIAERYAELKVVI